MTTEELRQRDGQAIEFTVSGESGRGYLTCSREKFQIVYSDGPAPGRASRVIELTEEMIDAVSEKDGEMSLTWASE